jgi:hypothetical protein
MTKQSTLPVLTPNNAPAIPDMLEAFFAALEHTPLTRLTVNDVMAHTQSKKADWARHYPTLGHMVRGFNLYVGAEMQDAISYDPQNTKRDVYFDLIMARLDAVQAYRDGVIALHDGLAHRPDLALVQLRHLNATLDEMLEAADDMYPAWQIPFKKAGLAALYARALHLWRQDESADLSKTMAGLDKMLEQAEYGIGKLKLG